MHKGWSRRATAAALIAASVVLLAACRQPESDEDVFFPTFATRDLPSADVGGTLVRDGLCLFAETDSARFLVMWREGYAFADGKLLDRNGNAVVSEGDRFAGGGGWVDEVVAERLGGSPIPDACRTDEYMLADEIQPA